MWCTSGVLFRSSYSLCLPLHCSRLLNVISQRLIVTLMIPTQLYVETLPHALDTFRLNYCDSVLYGLPKYRIRQSKLQRVQNAAARLVTNTKKSDHITPALYNP